MKLRCFVILITTVVFLSCSKEEDKRSTSTIIYKVYGSGNVDFITYAVDCYPEGQLGCAVEEGIEKQELPFEVQVDELFTDLIFLRVYVDGNYEKSNIDRLEITINGESRLLNKEDFWWTEWNGFMLLEHSVGN